MLHSMIISSFLHMLICYEFQKKTIAIIFFFAYITLDVNICTNNVCMLFNAHFLQYENVILTVCYKKFYNK